MRNCTLSGSDTKHSTEPESSKGHDETKRNIWMNITAIVGTIAAIGGVHLKNEYDEAAQVHRANMQNKYLGDMNKVEDNLRSNRPNAHEEWKRLQSELESIHKGLATVQWIASEEEAGNILQEVNEMKTRYPLLLQEKAVGK